MKSLVAIFLALAVPTQAETIFRSPPWLVSNGFGLNAEATCSIAGLTPLGTGLRVVASSENYQVQAFDIVADHAIEERVLIIQLPDGEAIILDTLWMGELANAVVEDGYEWGREGVDALLAAFSTGGEFVFFRARGTMSYGDWARSKVTLDLVAGQEAVSAFMGCVTAIE